MINPGLSHANVIRIQKKKYTYWKYNILFMKVQEFHKDMEKYKKARK